MWVVLGLFLGPALFYSKYDDPLILCYVITYVRMWLHWIIQGRIKSFERFKFKFKLPYLIWLQLPLSLWLLMIGMELEAIILHVDWPSVLMSLLLQIERKTTFKRYYSKRQRRFSTWIASRLNQLWTEAKRWFHALLAATFATRDHVGNHLKVTKNVS